MPIPAKNIIRAKDIRIAKVGRTAKAIPCQQIFSSYLENLRSGSQGGVPSHIIKALNECGEEWERVSPPAPLSSYSYPLPSLLPLTLLTPQTSKHQGAGIKYQLSLFKKHRE